MDSDTAVLRPTPPSDFGRVRPSRAGGYQIVRRLGQGGAGTVYLALDPKGKRVALKILAGDASDDELRRLAREGRLAKRLDHPNIVRVRGLGMQAGRAFLVLELVNGCSLQERLRAAGPLPLHDTLYLVEKIARALHYAHEEGILHRDVKPSNILLDRTGEPLLTDFGLAKAFEDRGPALTVAGDVLGTPSYMAPEQALGEIDRVDRRADVYGLGGTLYAMLTGSPPFPGKTWLHVLTAVVHSPPPRPSASFPLIDPQVERICLRCLSKDPERRFPTALEVAEELSVCARRLRGDTPSINELTAQVHALRGSRRGPPIASDRVPILRRDETSLRAHGESERLLALSRERSDKPLLLAGEQLRLKGESGEQPSAPKPSPRRRRSRARRPLRLRKVAVLPVALATAPLVLLLLGIGIGLLGPGAATPLTPVASSAPGPVAVARPAPPPREVPRPRPTPAAPLPAAQPSVSPPARDAPASSHDDEALARLPSPPASPPAPPTPEPKRIQTVVHPSRPLVIVRRGTATSGGEVFAAGDVLPVAAAMKVGPQALEVEGPDSAQVFLSARSRFEVLQANPQLELHLERGSLFARTLGDLHYAVSTPDGIAHPVGTEFLVDVRPARRTRITTLDGEVRIGAATLDAVVAVRRGFEATLDRGRVPLLPDPLRSTSRTFRWIPAGHGPELPSPPRLLRTFTFDDGERFGFAKGAPQRGGAMGSRYCLRGEAYEESDGRAVVRWEGERLFELAPGTWVEAMCRTEVDTELTFRLWDAKRSKNVKRKLPITGGVWTPVAVRIDTLRTSSGSQSALDLSGPCARFEITAGDCKGKVRCELRVDNLRVYQE